MRANERAKIALAVPEPGLHGGVLARRALAVVLVADGHPAAARLVAVLGDLGERLDLAVELVLALPASPVKALTAPRNRLPLMFSRWPRYRSHGPAAEMWSVVHLPLALTSTGSSRKSLPSQGANGSSSWRRSLVGPTDHLDALAVPDGARKPALARARSPRSAAPRRRGRRGDAIDGVGRAG